MSPFSSIVVAQYGKWEVTDSSKMTQIPWLDKILYKNRIADSLRRAPGLKILQYVATAVKERREHMARSETKLTERFNGKKDFLTRYIEIQEQSQELPPGETFHSA